MAEQTDWPPVSLVVAVGIFVVVGIVALGWALPPVLKAIGTAVGLAVAVGTTGLVSGTAAAGWIAPVAAAGIGATGAGVTILLLVKTVRQASKEPFEWAVALLGLGGAALADIAREFAVSNAVGKILVTTLVAFTLVVAAGCYKRGGLTWRATGIVLFLMVPALILTQNLDIREIESIGESFRLITFDVWARVLALAAVGMIIAVLHRVAEARHA